MIAEPPPVPASGKEAEIAEGYDKATANTLATAFIASVTKSIQDLFAALPADKQGELLAQLGEQLRVKNATLYDQTLRKLNGQSPMSVAGSLKNHLGREEYNRIMDELREQRRKEDELLYAEVDEAESGA